MSYYITKNCIQCHRCQSSCPTGAIKTNQQGVYIDSSLCNNCTGFYGTPQCASVCPTNQGCLPLRTNSDYWESWFSRYDSLVQNLKNRQKQLYWRNWFDFYAEKLSNLIVTQH